MSPTLMPPRSTMCTSQGPTASPMRLVSMPLLLEEPRQVTCQAQGCPGRGERRKEAVREDGRDGCDTVT